MWCQSKSALLAKLRPNAEQVLAVYEQPVPVKRIIALKHAGYMKSSRGSV